jgi:ADP-ribosylglycohydrolase
VKRPLPNTYWVQDGRFLAGEYPGGETPEDTRKRLEDLLAAGIDYFIDLTEPDERVDYRALLPTHVGYYRRALPDHGIPLLPAHMREVQAALRDALAAGRRIYVHCRAGIGRTGMAVGCWLGEEGLAGDAALERLNELWKQNARASRWPRVPETEAQREYVLRWGTARNGVAAAPVTAPVAARLPPRAAATGPVDRARGALLGLALGDVHGSAGQDIPAGAWTDDTAMALCQADSLLACGGVDTRDQAERYLRWLREGYRSATGKALGVRPEARRALGLAAARRSALSGSHNPRQLDPDPLVRCAPPVIFHADDLHAATEAAADAARVTHQAAVLVDACRLFAGMVHTALGGADRATVLAHHRRWEGMLRAEVLDLAAAWTEARQPAPRPRRDTILAALDAVVRAFATAPDFATGLDGLIRDAADADVLGAAYGQLAGAFWGEAGLPAAWRAGLTGAEELAALADALLPAALHPPAQLPESVQPTTVVPGRHQSR